MKKFTTVILYVLLTLANISAGAPQPPQAFNYQAIARDNSGNVLPNHLLTLRISILNDSASGNLQYAEMFTATTNQFGLFTINVGAGVPLSGIFTNINWAQSKKWMKVEADMAGGSNFILIGSSELLSVPYALYAVNSGYSYAQNTTTSVSPIGDTLYIGNTFVIMPGVSLANVCRQDFAEMMPYTIGYPHAGDQFYNSALYGLPKFISKNYIELDKIDSISRFRSGSGHDYSDSYESCRSMKHYFRPRYDVDWSQIKIFSPVNGVVSNKFPETIGGDQIQITPFGMPAFNVIIFHVNDSLYNINIGDTVWSGHQIGTHTGPQTGSDIAISIFEDNGMVRKVSLFDVMTDKLFACFMAHGIASRDSMIISKTDRDNDPLLPCNGQQFFYHGTITNWVPLH